MGGDAPNELPCLTATEGLLVPGAVAQCLNGDESQQFPGIPRILYVSRSAWLDWRKLIQTFPLFDGLATTLKYVKTPSEQLLVPLAKDLRERGGLNLEECFIDGTFVSG